MNITVRNVPEKVMQKLKALASAARRSLNSEIVIRLEQSVENAAPRDDDELFNDHLKVIKKVAGAWEDSRSNDEIIDEILASRTPGRDVAL